MDLARRSAQLRTVAALLLLAGSGLPIEAQSDGQLDETFWFDGRVTLDLPLRSVEATVVAPDGRLVVVGTRFNSGGGQFLFWTILNDDGMEAPCVPNAPGGGNLLTPHAAAFDSQGRLLIAGDGQFPTYGQEGFALRYLYPACDLDEMFNLDGIFHTNLNQPRLGGIAFDSNSRIVLAGEVLEAGQPGLLVVRLTDNGLSDFSFANFGFFELDLAVSVSGSAVAVQANDRIVVGGTISQPISNGDFLLLRLDPVGDLDGTFGGDGTVAIDVQTNTWDDLSTLVIDPVSGGILAAGSSQVGNVYRSALVRLDSSGELDDSFEDDGIWTQSLLEESLLSSMQLQSDGKILVAGMAWNNIPLVADFAVVRLLPSGEADPSFGLLGVSRVSFDLDPIEVDSPISATLYAGKIVVAGVALDHEEATNRRAVVARLWSDLVFADGFERQTTGAWSNAVDTP